MLEKGKVIKIISKSIKQYIEKARFCKSERTKIIK